MSARLVSPEDARTMLVGRLDAVWATAVCAEAAGAPRALTISLRPNVTSGAEVLRIGTETWERWRAAWRRLGLPSEAVAALARRHG